MRKQNNRRTGRQTFYVFFSAVELFCANRAQTAVPDICHIDQPDEMNPFLIKAVPSGTCRIFTKPLPELRTAIVDVVLAGHVEYILCFALFEQLVERIELGRVRKMA